MLRHFQASDKIKAPEFDDSVVQIFRPEEISWDRQFALIYVLTVHAQNARRSASQEFMKPNAGPAADIQHRPRLDRLHDYRHNDASGTSRSRLEHIEKALIVRRPRCCFGWDSRSSRIESHSLPSTSP